MNTKFLDNISVDEKELLNSIVEELFSKNFAKAMNEPGIYKWFADNASYDGYYINTDGCTKYVIIPDDSDYVIKIGHLGLSKDYCAREALNYSKAYEAGLECYFAKTFFFGEYDGINVYLQEKMCCDDGLIDDTFFRYAESTYPSIHSKEEEEDLYYDDINFAVDEFDIYDTLRACFGEHKETEELIKFCNDNDINDLHCKNFGCLTCDGCDIYIIDFSGYRE